MLELTHEDRDRYSPIYARLHWAIAVCVFSLFSMQYIRRLLGEDGHVLVREMHKSIGIVLIVLIACRLLLRLRGPSPRHAYDPSPLRAAIARLVHGALWLFMLAAPLLGVTFLLARGRGINFFGLLPIGPFTVGAARWGEIVLFAHRTAAFVLIALIIVHVCGALFHHLVLQDGLMRRMSIGSENKTGRQS